MMESGVHAEAWTSSCSHAHHHPSDPGKHPAAVFGTQKTHSASCPQGGGQKPPPSAARHDRGPLSPAASAPVVCRCRNLAAFWTVPTHHPLDSRNNHRTRVGCYPDSRRNAGFHAQARNCSGYESPGSCTSTLMQSPKVIAPRKIGRIMSRGKRFSPDVLCMLPDLAWQRRGLLMVGFHHVPTLLPEGVRSSRNQPLQRGGFDGWGGFPVRA